MIASTAQQPTQDTDLAPAIAGLMLLTACTLLAASLVHFGLRVPLGFATLHDPFPGAAVPEGLIALVLAGGAGGVVLRRGSRLPIALGTALFALLGACIGLRFTLDSARSGDIVYHLALLAALMTLVALIVSPAGRRSLRER